MSDEVGQGGDVGQIAAPLPGDTQLARRAVHFLKKQRLGPTFGGLPGGHQAGGAGADHDYAT